MTTQPDNGQAPADEGYFLEFHQIGAALKVSAIDPETGVEVAIIGSPLSPRARLAGIAVAKLKVKIAQKSANPAKK